MNSRPGATDGAFKLWVNGALVANLTTVGYTTAGQSAATKMARLAFGYQREGGTGETQVLEYHYWDNLVFSTTCPS
jgi:hypothetical protein